MAEKGNFFFTVEGQPVSAEAMTELESLLGKHAIRQKRSMDTETREYDEETDNLHTLKALPYKISY